ncbi:unnamed protein product [Schistosoma margrebowiei]|uniref:Tetraspanin n=1 Tax=Schistosoma margrebowiei TaxID=48269 RepID=A0AA84ZRR1_9TREM|nr:unnamed protein product [Schistosoma margrebowiei]
MILSQIQKYWNTIFILFNILLIIFDLALLILPFRILNILSNYNIILDFFKPIIYPVIICSGFLGLLSIFIGFIGIWKKKNIFISMHIIGLIIATIIEISITISSSVSNNQYFKPANQSLWNSLQYYQKHPIYENQFDNLQKDFECCGVRSSKDYAKLVNYLPFTCEKGNVLYIKGCAEALYEYIEQSITLIIYICIAFAIIKTIYLAISILVYRKSNKNNLSI